MIFRNKDKEAIKSNSYTTIAKIEIIGTDIVLTEDNYIVEFTYEDYRYVPNSGFIGEFVERILDGKLSQLPSDIILENAEINLKIGIVNGLDNNTTYYDYGNFLITSVKQNDTKGSISFESSDYTKKFNALYEDTITYPCIALDLVNNICEQLGVELDSDRDVYYYTPNTSLLNGDYSVDIDGKIYEFNLDKNLNKLDTLMFFENEKKVIIKTINNDYKITRVEKDITKVNSSSKTRLNLRRVKYNNFINNDFVIVDNQYTENNSYRDVIKDVSRLAYSWARINEHNRLCFDFTKKECYNIDEYDKLTTDEYYTSDKQALAYGPVNKVLIGMSQIEGENVYISTEDCTPENECAIKIYDNLLTYTDELRQIAIQGANVLFGIEYTPMNISSIGHPWLEGDELIQLTNVDNEVLYTYPFDRKIEYKGYIKSQLSSSAQTKIESQYENTSGITSKISRTEIIVNKQEKTIKGIVEDIGDRTGRETSITADIDGLSAEVKTVSTPISEDEGTDVRNIKDLMSNKLVYIQIHPTDRDIVSLVASTSIKASKGLKTLSKNVIFENEDTNIKFLLPTNLYFYNDKIYDEFVQDNINQECYVIHRVGIRDDGTKYRLTEEEKEIIEDYRVIYLPEGSYKVYMSTYKTAYIKVKGLIKNDYTSQLATNVELEGRLELTDQKFDVGLKKKLDGKDFTGANILLQINNDESEAQINADKVSLKGKKIDLTADNVSIASDKFNVDNEGNAIMNSATMNSATITGGVIYMSKDKGKVFDASKGLLTNLQFSSEGQWDGFNWLGYDMDSYHGWPPSYAKTDVPISYYIPDNFTVLQAYVTVQHVPITWDVVDYGEITGRSMNVRLYKGSGYTMPKYYMAYGSDLLFEDTRILSGSDTNTLEFTGGTTVGQITSANSSDISNYIGKGTGVFFLRTNQGNVSSETDAASRTGLVKAVLTVIGYINYSG